jgi:DnaK suppressor protein
MTTHPKMTQEVLAQFKTLFEEQRKALAFAHSVIDANLAVPQEEMMDEADLTSAELAAGMQMRLRSREALFAKKIDEALERIAHGSFGQCDSCGDDIELRRLEARPTATQCLGCKEESERMENVHIDGHRYKSLGSRLRLA